MTIAVNIEIFIYFLWTSTIIITKYCSASTAYYIDTTHKLWGVLQGFVFVSPNVPQSLWLLHSSLINNLASNMFWKPDRMTQGLQKKYKDKENWWVLEASIFIKKVSASFCNRDQTSKVPALGGHPTHCTQSIWPLMQVVTPPREVDFTLPFQAVPDRTPWKRPSHQVLTIMPWPGSRRGPKCPSRQAKLGWGGNPAPSGGVQVSVFHCGKEKAELKGQKPSFLYRMTGLSLRDRMRRE